MDDIKDLEELVFANRFDDLSNQIHAEVRANGFYEEPPTPEEITTKLTEDLAPDTYVSLKTLADAINLSAKLAQSKPPMNNSEKLMLVVTELGETCEGLRHGNPTSDKLPEYSAAEEELADAIIRIMDLAAYNKWRLGPAIIAKLSYNRGRPYKHGKRF